MGNELQPLDLIPKETTVQGGWGRGGEGRSQNSFCVRDV